MVICLFAFWPAPRLAEARPSRFHGPKIHPGQYMEVRPDVVTPHEAWGKPLAGGPIKVLVALPRICQRETIELFQRLDIKYRAFFIHPDMRKPPPKEFGHGFKGFDRADLIEWFNEELARNPDVIIIGGWYWRVIPDEIRKPLLARVKAGAGLILTSYNKQGHDSPDLNKILADGRSRMGARFILRGVPVERFPEFYGPGIEPGSPLVKAASLRRGRVVLFRYADLREPDHMRIGLTPGNSRTTVATAMHYDYFWSPMARAVVWAAGRQSKQQIMYAEAPVIDLDRERPDKIVVPLQVAAGTTKGLTVRVRIRSSHGEIVYRGEHRIEARGDGLFIRTPLPALPAGSHLIDLLLQSGKTLDWYSLVLEIKSASTIKALDVTPLSVRKGGKLSCRVRLSKALERPAVLRISVTDNWGRLVGQTARPIAAGSDQLAFRWPVEQDVAMVHRLRATLLIDGRPHSSREAIFYVQKPFDVNDFHFCMWGGVLNNVKSRIAWLKGQKYGIDVLYTGQWPDKGLQVKIHNHTTIPGIRLFHYTSNLWCAGYAKVKRESRYKGQRLVRYPCMHKETYRRRLLDNYRGYVGLLKPRGCIGYSTGDEYSMIKSRKRADICFGADTMKAFGKWLREAYRTLDRLNAQWATDFKSWDEVEPLTYEDAWKRDPRNLSPWADHRVFMQKEWSEWHLRIQDTVHQLQPGAFVGEEGRPGYGVYSGLEENVFRRMTLHHTYYRRYVDHALVRDLPPPLSMRGYWTGWYFPIEFRHDIMRSHPWNALMNRMNGTWFWNFGCRGSRYPFGCFTPDLRVDPYFDTIAREVRLIKKGIGKAVLNAERPCQAAAYFSSRSNMATKYAIQPEYTGKTGLKSRVASSLCLMSDNAIRMFLGVQTRFVVPSQLLDGTFARSAYKVLILSQAASLSDEEAAVIREFVKNGGIVIGGLRPGYLDEHLKVRDKGALDDVFGIARTSLKPPLDAKGQPVSVEHAGVQIEGKLPRCAIDAGIRATTGRAGVRVADSDAVVVNAYGKGRAVYLGFYFTHRGERTAHDYYDLLGDIFKSIGVRPEAAVTAEDGSYVEHASAMFDLDGIGIYLLRAHPIILRGRRVKVTWPRPYHVFEPLEPRPVYSGRRTSVVRDMPNTRARVFALMPYMVAEVSLQLETRSVRAGKLLAFRAKVIPDNQTPARTHVMRVELFDPDGKEIPYYAHNHLAPNGRIKSSHPTALNDKRGQWRLVARDVLTGVEANATFQVQPSTFDVQRK